MWIYGVILLLTGSAIFLVSLEIFRGRTDLIHDYHQKRVKDKKAYARAFGKAMMLLSLSLVLSGIVSLWGEKAMDLSLWILFACMAVSLIGIVLVQRRYNQGIF